MSNWIIVYLPNFTISMLKEGVYVISDGTTEKCWILWDDAKLCSEVMKPNFRDIYVIYYYLSSRRFYKAK